MSIIASAARIFVEWEDVGAGERLAIPMGNLVYGLLIPFFVAVLEGIRTPGQKGTPGTTCEANGETMGG